MSIYASFITEFGLFCFLAFLLLVLAHVAVHHGWSRRNICWFILLAYLYIQFEILYIIFDYSHKHYTFKQFEV